MVHGLEKFKEYFEEHVNQYIFIGGTACDILMNELGAPFRATKDLDIVLIIEALDTSFGERFWQFIEDGGYENREKSSGENQFYRFTKPRKSDYPKMIELFSRKSDNLHLKFETGLTPIHIDESIISLSAILLNDVYYETLIGGKRKIDGYSVIEIETIILFKIKAWLDMKEKKENGEHVDSKNIKKHKNDVFRLLANVTPSSRVEIAEEIEEDIKQFIEMINEDRPDLKNLRLSNTTFDELIEILENIYLKTSEAF
ncbi:MAG: nucleotidyl transferase AbiEii/AbiGii toxin family protein [Firmicutes bacterium]|nr:nucleotidyl transferase AbiEii/AbiGii toxin family protein [Bacillota bacterium]